MGWDIEKQRSIVYGNDKLRENLWNQVQSETGIPHHTLIFHGAKGLGKMQFAGQLSSVILEAAHLQMNGHIALDEESPAYRKLLRESHEDFLYLCPEKYKNKSHTIPMEALEDLQKFLVRKGSNKRRIVIIDAIDECVFNLQNALLKQLEEPPAGVLFFLIAHQSGKILDTIHSRAQNYRFRPLDNKDMKLVAEQFALNTDLDQATFVAGGAPGKLTALSEADLAGILEKFKQAMLTSDNNSPALHEFSEFISHPKNQNLEIFRLWSATFYQACLRNIYAPVPNLPEEWHEIVERFSGALQTLSAQNTFQASLNRLSGIQSAPMYLDPASTMVHIAYTWHKMLYPQHS